MEDSLPIGLEDISKLFLEVISSDEIIATTSVSIPNQTRTCKLCDTTYEDLKVHQATELHKSKLKVMKEKEERKKREAKNKTQDRGGESDPNIYYIRTGETSPEHHLVYIKTLTTFWALRYCFSNYNKDFKISLINSKWMEFGDIIIELWNNEKITEIQAIQCKQIQSRNTILLTALTEESGKFSLKSRCEILENLQKKAHFDKTYFKLYTVSNLTINRETFVNFKYDDEVLKSWNYNKKKEEWKDRSLIVPEYNKMNILNTTDEPTDICIFKILNRDGSDLDILNKFSMLTNQKKVEDLKYLIKSTLRNRFPHCKDITNDLVNYVSNYFKVKIKDIKHNNHNKLTKRDFLLKVTELLLEPYLEFPENFIQEESLELWNSILLNFDITVVKNHPDMLRKIYSVINYKLREGTKRDLYDFQNLNEVFDLYLTMWRDQLTPLVLLVDDETDLSLIGQLAEFLKEENISLKFIVLTKNPKIDRGIFPTNLRIFFNLQDLKETNQDLLGRALSQIEIKVLDFQVSLGRIVECNDTFLEKVTPDALLNMFLHLYSFEDIHLPLTDEVGDNTIVFTDEDIQKVKGYFGRQDTEPEYRGLSYVVNVKGKPTVLQVPPEL